RKLARPTAAAAHVILDAGFIHDVDYASETSDRFRIRERRRIAVFNHHVEARAHERDRAAVEDLLFEIIAFGFVLKGHFDDSGARGSDGFRDGASDLQRITRGVVIDSDASVDAFALLVFLWAENPRRVWDDQ